MIAIFDLDRNVQMNATIVMRGRSAGCIQRAEVSHILSRNSNFEQYAIVAGIITSRVKTPSLCDGNTALLVYKSAIWAHYNTMHNQHLNNTEVFLLMHCLE